MSSPNHILLFPHEHINLLGAIHNLSVRARNRPQLRTFLDEASHVVHREAATLTGRERASIGEFEDLVELAEQHVGQSSVVAEIVLLTTLQVGQLLMQVSENRSRSSSSCSAV
jgi:hypothetical protein